MGVIDRHKDHVIEVASAMFLEKGIKGVTLLEIAEKAEVGTASVYRYFLGKNTLIIESAIRLWEKRLSELVEYYDKIRCYTGIEQLELLTRYYPKMVIGDERFSRFLIMLDALFMNDEFEQADRKRYDDIMLEFYKIFELAYKAGRKDGTVREIDNFFDFYFASTQSILGLWQKLSVRGNILSTDKERDEKIKILLDLMLNYYRRGSGE